MQSKVLVRFSSKLFILIILLISFKAGASNFLDEFTSIYHSEAIIEVGALLDETGYPKESCYLKKIKGDKKEIKEILDVFGICEKKRIRDLDQKRLMFFYRNKKGQWRSMNLIKDKVGPYSDEETYKHYLKMVKYVDRKLKKYKGKGDNLIILDDRSICRSLKRNKYFSSRYSQHFSEDGFTVGGTCGVFKEFYPVVKVDCENRS